MLKKIFKTSEREPGRGQGIGTMTVAPWYEPPRMGYHLVLEKVLLIHPRFVLIVVVFQLRYLRVLTFAARNRKHRCDQSVLQIQGTLSCYFICTISTVKVFSGVSEHLRFYFNFFVRNPTCFWG